MDYRHLEKYYRGKKVFVTGHTGFKGTWLINWLSVLGARIKGYSLEPVNQFDLYNSTQGASLCESSVYADILNADLLKAEILSFEPDFIFHLAAQPLVRLSYQQPAQTFSVNAIGTAHLLDGVRELKNRCQVILITTDKVYENKEWHYPYRENDRLGGYDPYSASKACAELVINSYRNSFFNLADYPTHQKAIASARAGNVIGGGDWAQDRIIPDIIRAFQKGIPVEVRNPNAVRPWQHVLEPLGGYLHLGAKMTDDPIVFSDSWNFGPLAEDNLTVEELVNIAVHIWGTGEYKNTALQGQPHEAGLLKLDISKTVSTLGWRPKYNATTSIKNTMEWYLRSTEKLNEAELVKEQISHFIHD